MEGMRRAFRLSFQVDYRMVTEGSAGSIAVIQAVWTWAKVTEMKVERSG